MSALNFVLTTPLGVLYEGEASAVTVPSADGPLGLLPGYTTLISELAPKGILTVTDLAGKKHYFLLGHGALTVRPDRVLLLASGATAYPDLESAKKALKGE